MFSGLTNQVNSWIGKKPEGDVLKAEGDALKSEESADASEKREFR